jgi:26S proteasome regulatory subunit N6
MAIAPAKEDEKRVEEAQKLAKSDPSKAEAIYKDVLTKDPGSGDIPLRNFEKALVGLGELFKDQKRAKDLANLIQQTRSALSSFAKSKTAKLGMFFSFLNGQMTD